MYDLLQANARDNQELAVLDGGGVDRFQALSHYESAEAYRLKTTEGAHDEKILPKGGVQPFFEAELGRFLGLYERHGSMGCIIHCQGKTCALAIVEQGGQPVYFLFDSHGSQLLNGNKNAFVVATRNQNRMAQILTAMYPFQATERFVPGEAEIPVEAAESMERENNSYVAFPVTYQGKLPHEFEEEVVIPVPDLGIPIDEPPQQPDAILERELEKIREHKLKVFGTLFTLSVLVIITHYRKPLSHYIWRPKPPIVLEAPPIRVH